MDDRIQKRFGELALMTEKVANTTRPDSDGISMVVDIEVLTEWKTSVLSLLSRIFGKDHSTYLDFDESRTSGFDSDSESTFVKLRAIFASAKDEFEGGYLFDVRNLVHADVFADELEQAKHFLDKGYKVPAAVIAGTVLETTLRELCNQHSINPMNQDLAGTGIYNKMRATQIQAWGKIRNDAAHGNPNEFEPPEVARMIDGIRDFIAGHMN